MPLPAAEAAIANPLLDETSMKGAQGLLISITGGRDMTLFEVDEAATRIREEVDPDANIILGATFDEALEGIIRVSVVATGIDRAAAGAGEQRPFEAGRWQRPVMRRPFRDTSARRLQHRAVMVAISLSHDGNAGPLSPLPSLIRSPTPSVAPKAEMERELEIAVARTADA